MRTSSDAVIEQSQAILWGISFSCFCSLIMIQYK